MSEGLNRVMLLGNAAADPELRYTQAGQAVMSLRVATNERYQDKDKEWRERTDFHSCVVWGKRAEGLQKVLRKGTQVYLEGSLRTSSYEKDGQKRYKTEIIVSNVVLCGGRGDGQRAEQGASGAEGSAPATGARGGGRGGNAGYAQGGGGGYGGGRAAYGPGGGDAAEDFDAGGGYGGSNEEMPF